MTFVYEDVPYDVISHGRAELRKFAADTFAAVADVKIEAVSASLQNGHGVVEWVWHGIDKGLFKTGKPFSIRRVSVFEVRGGKISRNKDFYDFVTIMRQVGALPAESADDQTAIERELTQIELDWTYAALKKDAERIRRILADDFVGTDEDGKVSGKADRLADLESGGLIAGTTRTDDIRVMELNADAAVVTGRDVFKNAKWKSKDGKVADISSEYR